MAKSKRSTSIKLRTQKDGRLYAIALLKRLEKESNDDLCAYQRDPSDGEQLRAGPQSDVVLRAFERVMYFGTSQAILGFFCVMTDFIGSAKSGYVYPESFAKWERRGVLQHWRLPKHDASKEARHG